MRPAPLTPPESDLRGFDTMPLDIARLQKSRAWVQCKRRPELAFYMLNLWVASWQECPAASLEADDEMLADRAMCDPLLWPSIKPHVMRGWILCNDGRVYHPTVAGLANIAWESRCKFRTRMVEVRETKKRKALEKNKTDSVASSVTGSDTGVKERVESREKKEREETPYRESRLGEAAQAAPPPPRFVDEPMTLDEADAAEPGTALVVVPEPKPGKVVHLPDRKEPWEAFEAYNALAQELGLRMARGMPPGRVASLRARLREVGGMAGWREALDMVRKSAFITSHAWASFGLHSMLQPETLARILEGTYTERFKSDRQSERERQQDELAALDRQIEEFAAAKAKEHHG